MSHFVYVCLDADRQPLYVGCTTDVKRRMKEHRGYRAPWVAEVAHQFVTEFPTRAEALAAETERIQSLRPLWNRRHNPRAIRLSTALARHEWITEFNRINGFEEAS